MVGGSSIVWQAFRFGAGTGKVVKEFASVLGVDVVSPEDSSLQPTGDQRSGGRLASFSRLQTSHSGVIAPYGPRLRFL